MVVYSTWHAYVHIVIVFVGVSFIIVAALKACLQLKQTESGSYPVCINPDSIQIESGINRVYTLITLLLYHTYKHKLIRMSA